MALAYIFRRSVNRRDIYDTLVVAMKKLLPDYPGSETIHLLYQARFHMKEVLFLENLDISMKSADEKITGSNTHYKDAQGALFAHGAQAAWRRGNKRQAFEYACSCFRQSENITNHEALEILLNCMKGQPQEDILFFMNSIFDTGNGEKRDWIIKSLRMDGYAPLFAYYSKKKIVQKTAAIDDHLLYLILLGHHEEAVKIGLSQYNTYPRLVFE